MMNNKKPKTKNQEIEEARGWSNQQNNSTEDLMAVHIDNISNQQTIEKYIFDLQPLVKQLRLPSQWKYLEKFSFKKSGCSLDDGLDVNFNNSEEEEKTQTISQTEQNIRDAI
ncbi:unnamed protein product [Paramecium octaurelia]|uniref:Uncharacterized protein n=1 Tax=Paramecium octaurelia TaxID=43137 RepID=A0A8S1YL22_PAROT|nr:unnamed protein product [Paramecium octaurelia]